MPETNLMVVVGGEKPVSPMRSTTCPHRMQSHFDKIPGVVKKIRNRRKYGKTKDNEKKQKTIREVKGGKT